MAEMGCCIVESQRNVTPNVESMFSGRIISLMPTMISKLCSSEVWG